MPFTPHWSRKVSGGGEAWYLGGVRAPLSLAYGNPDPSLFPARELEAAAARVLADREAAGIALQYGPVQGQPAFIEMVAGRLAARESLSLTRENVVITNGASAAIGLAARALLDEGDTVLVEAPSFPGALSIFKRAGAVVRNLSMGPDGIDVEGAERLVQALIEAGERPRIIYTIPTFQNPTGLTLPETSRIALLSLARRHDLVIIEDDAYRDLYYDAHSGRLPASLLALDTDGRVIRTGTFSKILTPGMRLGWAAAQPQIISRMLLLKDEGGTSPFAQALALEYARRGALDAHISALVDAYRARRDAMLSALEEHFPPHSCWTHPAGGFFVWVTLPAHVPPGKLAALAREQGVEYLPGEVCFAEPPALAGTHLRLAFSLLAEAEIREAVRRLADVVRSLVPNAVN